MGTLLFPSGAVGHGDVFEDRGAVERHRPEAPLGKQRCLICVRWGAGVQGGGAELVNALGVDAAVLSLLDPHHPAVADRGVDVAIVGQIAVDRAQRIGRAIERQIAPAAAQAVHLAPARRQVWEKCSEVVKGSFM